MQAIVERIVQGGWAIGAKYPSRDLRDSIRDGINRTKKLADHDGMIDLAGRDFK